MTARCLVCGAERDEAELARWGAGRRVFFVTCRGECNDEIHNQLHALGSLAGKRARAELMRIVEQRSPRLAGAVLAALQEWGSHGQRQQ